LRTPIRFQVGDTAYTLLSVAEPIYDNYGEELLTKIDHDRHLFIVSDRCRGRHAAIAAISMMLSAWQHHHGGKPMDYHQLSAAATAMERFLVDVGLHDDIIDRLTAGPPTTQTQSRFRTVRRGFYAAALIAISAAAWWFTFYGQSPGTPDEPTVQAVTANTPLPDAAQGLQPITTPWPDAVGRTAAHPIDPAFVFSTPEGEIRRIDLEGNTQTLAPTRAPVHWLSFSPDGRYLAACDLQNNLYRIPWDNPDALEQWTAESQPLAASIDNRGNLTWLDSRSAVFVTDADSNATTRLLDCQQAVPAVRDDAVVARIRTPSNQRQLELQIDGQPLPIRVELTDDQLIHSLDASDARRTLTLLLNDGLLLVYRTLGDGRYRLDEHRFPAPFGVGQVRISRDGRTALLVTDQLYRFDTQRLRTTAQSPLPDTGGPVFDLVWRESLNEIALARTDGGIQWQP
jgi:hypothetical protein